MFDLVRGNERRMRPALAPLPSASPLKLATSASATAVKVPAPLALASGATPATATTASTARLARSGDRVRPSEMRARRLNVDDDESDDEDGI